MLQIVQACISIYQVVLKFKFKKTQSPSHKLLLAFHHTPVQQGSE